MPSRDSYAQLLIEQHIDAKTDFSNSKHPDSANFPTLHKLNFQYRLQDVL